MITVRGWHGYLSDPKSAKMDGIATVVEPKVEWTFNGTIGEFAEKYQLPFLAWPMKGKDEEGNWSIRRDPSDPPPIEWAVYITDYPTFQAR